MEKWIILGLAVALIVAGVVWMLTFARKPSIPPGKLHRGDFRKFKVRLVISDRLGVVMAQPDAVARACAKAVWATASAYEASPMAHRNLDAFHASDRLRDIVVHVASDAFFDSTTWSRDAAAYATTAAAKVGPGIPKIVVRPRVVAEIMEGGEPIIHESLHIVLGQHVEIDMDRDHSNKEAWAANAIADLVTIQDAARKLFKDWRTG